MSEQQVHVHEAPEQPRDQSKIRPQIIASTIVNLALFSCGLCYSWASLHLPLEQRVVEDIAVPVGAVLGAIVSGLLVDHIGRKWLLHATSGPFLSSWILVYFLKRRVGILIARLVAGLSVGVAFTIVPIYLGELVEARIRGVAIGMMPLLFNLGCLVMNGVDRWLNPKMMALIGLIPAALYLLSAPWLPESPYYDALKKKEKCTALSLAWLRRRRRNDEEIQQIEEFVNLEPESGAKSLLKMPSTRNSLIIVLVLVTGQQLSGLLVVQAHSAILFQSVKLPVGILFLSNGISVLGNVLAMPVFDRLGRKPAFLVSSYGSAVCLLIIGAFLTVDKYGTSLRLGHLTAIPMAASALYTLLVAFGLPSVPFILSSELFPMRAKSWANMIATIYGSLLAIIVTGAYRYAIREIDYNVVILIFAVVELAIAIAASVLLKETARKSFGDIQSMLKGNGASTSNT